MKNLREDFLARMPNWAIDKLVFVDEAGINTSMARRYGWSKEPRLYGFKPGQKGRNVTMIGALRLTGPVTAMTIDGSADGQVFLAFVEQLLIPRLEPGDIVVLDNVSTHKIKAVAAALEAAGIELVFLPPYSPELNPIEECWSKVKGLMRKAGARTRAALDQAVKSALEAVTPSNIVGWFQHAGYV